MTTTRSAEREDLVEVLADQQRSPCRARRVAEMPVDRLDSSDIEAASRRGGNETFGSPENSRASTTFWKVASGAAVARP